MDGYPKKKRFKIMMALLISLLFGIHNQGGGNLGSKVLNIAKRSFRQQVLNPFAPI